MGTVGAAKFQHWQLVAMRMGRAVFFLGVVVGAMNRGSPMAAEVAFKQAALETVPANRKATRRKLEPLIKEVGSPLSAHQPGVARCGRRIDTLEGRNPRSG